MARRYVWFGSKVVNAAFIDGDAQPPMRERFMFPDLDTRRGKPGELSENERELLDPRAIALAPETDIDLVRVYIGDDAEGFLLGPGMMVHLSGFDRVKVRVQPAVPIPPTRTTAAPGRTKTLPAKPAGWSLRVDNPTQLRYSGAGTTLYAWDGAKWVPGAYAVADTDSIDLAWYLDADLARVADLSFDGLVSINDMVLGGAFGTYLGVTAYFSKKQWDANGNAGDNGAAYPALSPPPPNWVPGYAAQPTSTALAPIVSTWCARCGLEVWEGCDPGVAHKPKLAPFRRVYLNAGDIAVPDEAATPDGVVAVVVPGYNVAGATFVGNMAAGTNPIKVSWATPWPKDVLGTPSKAIAEEAVDFAGGLGSFQSSVALLADADLLQVQLKGQGASTLKNGAVLTLQRKHIG